MNELLTNRELAEWLAKGNGEWKLEPSYSGIVYTTYKYLEYEADFSITLNRYNQRIVVRRFGEKEWHSPTRDYIKNGKDYQGELVV